MVLVAVCVVGVVVPIELDVFGWSIRTGAIRPAIWASAVQAVTVSPLIGVGAAPFLAFARHPMGSGEPYAWDAHQAYLCVVGQFGLVGAALMGGGLALIVRAALATSPSRPCTATLAALAGVAAHGLFTANEDFRHAWALLGLAGALGATASMRGPDADGSHAA